MENLTHILFLVFIGSCLVQLFYQLYFFSRIYFYKPKINPFNNPVSIIICAKDEAENIKSFLPTILEQDYPNFEVILVDDKSRDNTEYVLKDLEKQYPHLKVVKIEEHVNSRLGKKFALTLGIKAAKYDYLLLTDADCRVTSNKWLATMAGNFSNTKQIVLGFGAYKKEKGLLNLLIRFDAFNTAVQYFSYSLSCLTYMGVGRNLAYKKSLFFENKGFASHIHLPSGDDDLFVQEVANANNVAIELSPETHTISEPKYTWKEWIWQRKRHVSTANYYQFKYKFLLALFPLAQLLFWFSFLGVLLLSSTNDLLAILLIVFSFKILITYIINYRWMKHLKSLDLLVWAPLLEIVHLLVQVFFVSLSPNKTKSW